MDNVAQSTRQQYEFNDVQNETFRSVSLKMRVVGVVLFLAGAVMGWVGLFSSLTVSGGKSVPTTVTGFAYLAIGFWTVKAANSFKLIATTEGSDITHLMDAIVELKKLYTLQFWVVIVGVVLATIGFALGVAAAASSGMH